MTKLCFIGHFGGNELFREGQTVKTQNIAEVLTRSEEFCIKYVDTYYYKRNVLKFCTQLIAGLISCKRVILCVSRGGRRVFFPLLYWCAKLLKKKVYHFLVGGRLAGETSEKCNWPRYMQSFCVNWVESHLIAEELRGFGVTNAEYLPNFKKLPVVTNGELCYPQGNTTTFCMFSRITEGKGVTEAIEAVAEINQKCGRNAASLDLYGPIAPDYEDVLSTLLAEHSEYARYCGVAEPESSVDVLRKYDISQISKDAAMNEYAAFPMYSDMSRHTSNHIAASDNYIFVAATDSEGRGSLANAKIFVMYSFVFLS